MHSTIVYSVTTHYMYIYAHRLLPLPCPYTSLIYIYMHCVYLWAFYLQYTSSTTGFQLGAQRRASLLVLFIASSFFFGSNLQIIGWRRRFHPARRRPTQLAPTPPHGPRSPLPPRLRSLFGGFRGLRRLCISGGGLVGVTARRRRQRLCAGVGDRSPRGGTGGLAVSPGVRAGQRRFFLACAPRRPPSSTTPSPSTLLNPHRRCCSSRPQPSPAGPNPQRPIAGAFPQQTNRRLSPIRSTGAALLPIFANSSQFCPSGTLYPPSIAFSFILLSYSIITYQLVRRGGVLHNARSI